MLNSESVDIDLEIKLALVGDSGVGKTSIINQYISQKFNLDVKATIGESHYSKILKLKNQNIQLSLWDTAGQERYRSLSKIFLKNSNIIIFVYDITKSESFINIKKIWAPLVNELIGNDDIQKYHHIKAHENTIEIIEINFTGTKFSSASDKGTIIRIFNIKDDTLIHEFRRGTEQAIIYNISFDLNDTLLVVSSNRPTVHLFALNKDIQNSKSMFNGISKILGVGKILQSEWSFAKITVQSNCKSNIACFSDQNKIVIINYLGNFIEAVYGVKPDSSIECKVVKNDSIFENE
jgi:signal recognition particle receptor subunit beta